MPTADTAPIEVNLKLVPHEMALVGKLKVYAFHDFSSCGFYRCFIPARYMIATKCAEVHTSYMDNEALEADVTIPPQVRLAPRWHDMQHERVLKGIEWADVVVLQRMAEQGGLELIELCKKAGKPVVHEVDDMCEDVIPGNPAYWYWRDKDRLERHAESFRRSDFVTTTNPRLAQFYAKNYGRPVAVLPNCIDYGSSRWTEGMTLEKGPGVVVGWMASESHKVDEDQIREAVIACIKELPEVRFEFCGYFPDWAQGVPRVSHKAGDITSVPRLIQNWDIGLCPIVDHPFNTVGKSDIKFLEYSMVNCATVAPDLEPYRSSVIHGGTGLLVKHDDPESWVRAITKLTKRKMLREQIAYNAHEWVRKNRMIHYNVIQWYRLYCALAARVPVQGLEVY